MNNEQILEGGQSTEVVKIGNTVHRSLNKNSKQVHKLLKLLEQKAYKYAPRYLGMDEEGKEILSFIPGEVPREHFDWTEERLIKACEILKEFHDCTEGSELVEIGQVICHRDYAPWNIVVDRGEIVGVIDFDGAEPGKRVEDLAYFLWTFLELGSSKVSDDQQLERIRNLCKVYGHFNGAELVEVLVKEQERILQQRKHLAKNSIKPELRRFSSEKLKIIENEIKWVKKNRATIENNVL